MELLIAAGIAALGYSMSVPERTRSVAPVPPPPQVTVANARAEEERAAAATIAAAADPLRTGVISTTAREPQPYFRSARTQNTNDAVKNRLHDLFTGSNMFDASASGTYKKKVEAEARFQPLPQQVTSSGSSGNPVCWQQQLPTPSLLQNNVLPAEQVRVGPGVGVGPEVSAADGFHPMLRVMPKNVNEHRINQLPTVQINVGKARNAARPADPAVNVNRPPRVWDMNRRPPEKTMAAVTARTHRSEIVMRCESRPGGEDYFGMPAKMGARVPTDATAHTRDRSDNNPGLPTTNLTDARRGTGAYTYAEFDTQRVESQNREQASRPGALGHMVPTGSNRHADTARTTLRQMIAGPADNGPAAPVHKGPTVQCTYKQLNKEAKRPNVEGYVPGVQRTTEFRRANVGDADPWEIAGMCKGKWIALRERDHANRILSHGASSSMYTNIAPPGQQTGTFNKLPEVNPRQDFGLAQAVLAKNQLLQEYVPSP